MKELTYFQLAYCPYCRRASGYLEELKKENPAYCAIPITTIDEEEDPRVAKQYDFYYVPCFFLDGKKLHEGPATRADIEDVLKKALE